MDSIAYFLDKDTFEIKDVVQVQDYQINLDEETNAKTSVKTVNKPNAQDKDIIFIKEKENTVFMGVIEAPSVEEESSIYQINAKYITNLFDRKIILRNSNLIKEQGIEDFIAYTIENEFLDSEDALLNINYIDVEVLTHTIKKFSVSTENGIYNFHTFINNCTQNYGIVYNFKVINGRLKITIENIENVGKEIIDTNVSDILNYVETFQTKIVSKVTVLCKDNTEHSYFLLNDRTTTENMNAENRAIGDTEVIYEEETEDAKEAAMTVLRSNSYSHLIQFDINKNSTLYNVKDWRIGTLLKMKNKIGEIIDTYISAITIKKDNPIYSVKTGNIRINFLDKIKQEKVKEGK